MRATLAPHPGVGVIHLVSGVDCVLWILYGYDAAGEFRLESACLDRDASEVAVDLLRTLEDQLHADVVDDPLAVASLDEELIRAGDALGATWSEGMVEMVEMFSHLFFVPDSFGNIGEFPLEAVRIHGRWLDSSCTITRSPTFNHLRESIGPNRVPYPPNDRAVVVLGAPDIGGPKLAMVRREADSVCEDLGVLGFACEQSEWASRDDMRRWLDGEAGALYYVGHGVSNEALSALPLGSGEEFTPENLNGLEGMRVPFVFLCACVAGRVRHGEGGFQSGLASRLLERGAPAVVAFLQPIPEQRAYAVASEFRRRAYTYPFGRAIAETREWARQSLPTYTWLSLVGYGDPRFELRAMPTEGPVPSLPRAACTWDSEVRRHCVWRNEESAAALRERLEQAPVHVAQALVDWLKNGLHEGAQSPTEALARMELLAIKDNGLSDAERLSLLAAAEVDHLHTEGYDALPLQGISEEKRLLELHGRAYFISQVGRALFDMPFNALGNSLLGRIFVAAQGGIERGENLLREGSQSLHGLESYSEFAAKLRAENQTLLRHFGR